MQNRRIFVTEEDMERLKYVVQSVTTTSSKDWEHLEMLQRELDRAEVVPSEDIPADVVTMNSRVLLRNLDTGIETTYTLVFPRNANAAQGRISVLAPIGTAMIGYRAADEIISQSPAGERHFKVKKILFQPEAAAIAA